MDSRAAIIAYAQSEKIKSGLIWICQLAEMTKGLNGEKRIASENTVQNLIGFVASEASLAQRVAGDQDWRQVEANIEKARVMAHSGVFDDVTWHLTQALSQTTNIGQKNMSFLLEQNLI